MKDSAGIQVNVSNVSYVIAFKCLMQLSLSL